MWSTKFRAKTSRAYKHWLIKRFLAITHRCDEAQQHNLTSLTGEVGIVRPTGLELQVRKSESLPQIIDTGSLAMEGLKNKVVIVTGKEVTSSDPSLHFVHYSVVFASSVVGVNLDQYRALPTGLRCSAKAHEWELGQFVSSQTFSTQRKAVVTNRWALLSGF